MESGTNGGSRLLCGLFWAMSLIVAVTRYYSIALKQQNLSYAQRIHDTNPQGRP